MWPTDGLSYVFYFVPSEIAPWTCVVQLMSVATTLSIKLVTLYI